MPYLDRDSFIALLNRLGDDDDSQVLSAARELDRRLREAGADWNDLLAPPPGADDDENDLDDADADDVGAVEPLPAGEAADDAARIRQLLDKYDLLDDTREDLEDMLEMIEEGEFSDMDRRYVRALEDRLRKAKSGR